MRQQIAVALTLIREPFTGWAALSVLGSCVIAGFDTLGVVAMLPLMQLVLGASPDTGIPAFLVRVLGTDDTRTLIPVVACVVGGAFVVKSLATVAFRWWLLGHTSRLTAHASTELFRRYVSAPYWAHRQRQLAEIHRALATAVPQSFSQVILGCLSLAPDVLTLAAIAVVLLFVSPLATVLAAGFFALLALILQRGLRNVHRGIGQEMARGDLDAWNALMPGINGFRESRLSATTGTFVGRFADAKLRTARAGRRLSLVSELPKYVLEIGLIAGIALVAGVMFATTPPEYALSTLAVFAVAATRMLPTLNRALATTSGIRAGAVGLDILFREITALDEHGYHDHRVGPGRRFHGDIEFHRVSYRFADSQRTVVEGVSTVIPRGATVAIVGGSGAGKSTVLDLLTGLLEPTRGTITCGGRDIREDLDAWYAGIGVVPQEVFVLDDSVRANIAFGLEAADVDEQRLGDAVERAQLQEIIEQLPHGLDTRLGERGVRLSGGQRQRIGIARALYRRPGILVLDEATSALDNETERRITGTIETLGGHMTIVMVAHRLSTVKNADRVLFMSDGRIETEGTFPEVERDNPGFAHLVALGRL